MEIMLWVGLGALIGSALGIGIYVCYTCWKYYGSYELSSCWTKEKSKEKE